VFFLVFGVLRARQGRVSHSTALLCVATAILCAGVGLESSPSDAQQTPLLLRKNGLLEQVDSEYNTIFVEKQNSFISLNFGYRAIAIPNPSSISQTRAIWSLPIPGT
jgi:hypothetical protein